MTDVTRILSQIESGDPSAADHLLPLVYDELRKLAAAKLTHERPGQTLQATALVHEAYLPLIGPDKDEPTAWNSRGHFFSAAAESMRRILVEQARRKAGAKAGGGRNRVALSKIEPQIDDPGVDLIALDEALEKLQTQHPRSCELVKLRFFAGLTNAQAAKALGMSSSTADNDWAYAKSWLRVEMAENGEDSP